MNSRRNALRSAVYALLLIALMVAAYVPAAPVKADTLGVVVVTETVTVDSSIYFYVNLTYLRDTLGWVGTGVDIYVSNNFYATITPNDYVAVPGVYIVGVDYIAGTIKITSDMVNQLLNGTSGYLYLKVTDGANVVASNRFYVVTNVSDVISTTTDLSYVPNNEVPTTNELNFEMDLSSLGLGVNLTDYNISVVMTSTDGVQTMTLYYNDTTGGTSDVVSLSSDSVTADTVSFTGTLLNFPLETTTDVVTVHGKPVNFTKFYFQLNAEGDPVNLTGTVKLINNGVEDDIVTNHSLPNVVLAISSLGQTINIYPSVELTAIDPTVVGDDTQLNPGDEITVTIHNYLDNTDTLTVCLFDDETGAKIAEVETSLTVGSDGSQTISITLPEAPYGGRDFFVMVKQGADFRGLPAVDSAGDTAILTILPYLDVAVVKNDGTFKTFNSETNIVPGDYLLVKGHGFMNESISLYIANSTVGTWELTVKLDSDGDTNITVNESGMFFAIAQIPSDVDASATNYSIYAVGTSSTNVGFSFLLYNFNFSGEYYKVFVNPVPKWVGTEWIEDSAFIDQTPIVNPAYPAETPWLDQLLPSGFSNFTVEVMGVNFTDGSISLVNGSSTFTAADVTFTNGYYFGTVDVPVAPYGPYYVSAENGTVYFNGSLHTVYVDYTARMIDPVAYSYYNMTVYNTTIWIGEPVNVTIVGYGWPGSADVNWTIYKDDPTVNVTATFTTNVDGTFEVLTNISGFLSDNGEGTYHLVVEYNSSIREVFTIYYNITPPVTIEVHTGTLKMTHPGDTVDVYVIVYLGDELANGDDLYNTTVLVTVYYHDGSVLHKLVDHEEATYTGEPGIWHYRFNVAPEVKGDELLIKVEVSVQPRAFMIPQTAMAFDSLTVAGGLQEYLDWLLSNITTARADVLDAIADAMSSLNLTLTEINGQLAVISDTLTGEVVPALYLIQDLVDNANAQLLIVLENQDSLSDQITGVEENLTEQIGNVYLELVAVADNVALLNMKVDAGLDLLTLINATVGEIYQNTVQLSTDLGNFYMDLSDLITGMNATLVQLLVGENGSIMALINTRAGELQASIEDAKTLLMNGMNASKAEVLASLANLSSDMTAYATSILADLGIIKSNLTKLDQILTAVDDAKSEIISTVNSESESIKDKIESNTNTIRGDITTTQQAIDNAKTEVVNLINQVNETLQDSLSAGFDSLSSQISSSTSTLSSKLDNLQNTLTGELDNLNQSMSTANKEMKSRVTLTTLGSMIVVLIAVIGSAAYLSRGRS